MRLKILFFFLVFSALFAQSETELDSLITTGINQIYSIKFEEANSTFSTVRQKFPAHPAGYFFDAAIVWWRILLDLDNEDLDDLFYDKIEETLDICDEVLDEDENNFDAILFKGGALGYRGRLLSIRRSFINAAMDGQEAMPLIHHAYKINPENVDIQLGFGIYNYYAVVIPERYPIAKPLLWFLPPGDREKGLEEIINVAENGHYARLEAVYFLATILSRYEKDYDKAIQYLVKLHEEFPDNPRFQSFLGRTYIRNSNWATGVEVFKNVMEKCENGYAGYLKKYRREAVYYVGEYLKNHNKPEEAEPLLSECYTLSRALDTDRVSGYLINTALYLGQVSDQLGKRKRAIELYEEVLDYRNRGNSHEQAERYLKNPYGK